LAAPKGTPPDIIKKLHDAFKQGMDDPVLKKNAADMAVNLDYLGPEAFGKLIAGDHDFYEKLVKGMK
jgi:tripartite-type tricarboxylate transporter receptor subunit TctC